MKRSFSYSSMEQWSGIDRKRYTNNILFMHKIDYLHMLYFKTFSRDDKGTILREWAIGQLPDTELIYTVKISM